MKTIYLVLIAVLFLFSCSNKNTEENLQTIVINKNFGSSDLQDKIFVDNDIMIRNEIENKLDELAKELNIKSNSNAMIALNTNNNAKYKDMILNYLSAIGIDLNRIHISLNETNQVEKIEFIVD